SSFCFNAASPSVADFASGTASAPLTPESNCNIKHCPPSSLNWEIAVVNVATAPPEVLNFNVVTAAGDCRQSEMNSVAPPPFSAAQTEASCAVPLVKAAPKTFFAAVFA